MKQKIFAIVLVVIALAICTFNVFLFGYNKGHERGRAEGAKQANAVWQEELGNWGDNFHDDMRGRGYALVEIGGGK